MTTTAIVNHVEHEEVPRGALEHEADAAKDRLLHTLEKLDRRRHHAVESVEHVGRDFVIAAIVGGVAIGLLLGEIRFRAFRARRPKSALAPYRARWGAMRRAWTNPERVASRSGGAGGKSLLEQMAVKAIGALASMLLARVAKGAAETHGAHSTHR